MPLTIYKGSFSQILDFSDFYSNGYAGYGDGDGVGDGLDRGYGSTGFRLVSPSESGVGGSFTPVLGFTEEGDDDDNS